ncbi:TIGR04028 family ABC transporter substrate-binding protein [Schumannella luteola]|uniref:Peptide/nickel transport system substrate-binding protein n=1 Tax=Schumannella luteola TaxID=472059 RepID=A0A852YQ68_9MICO|nr:ABC transporter substrate-binding protein [Schumannella luteola]NYG99355.1 peptide/nickel transport system substrate-binding protein [Schumannella luteola]TPX06084.1 ABC transporter substrate-binding protein [Schumannella luteola]
MTAARPPRPARGRLRLPRLAGALAVTAAVSLALSACAGGAAAGGGTGDATKPVDGGDLSFAIANDPISLNPSGTGSGNDTLYVTRQLFDSLLYQSPKDGSLKPWLASSWEANDDATRYTFHLRDDVTFSDGTALTSAEVKGTFDDIVAAGAKSTVVSAFLGYSGTETPDEHTAVVTFSTPNAAFPNSTSQVGLGIVSAAGLKIPYSDRATGDGLYGSGPFVLKKYTKDVETVLEKRDDYAWGPASLNKGEAAHLDSVTFQVVPEASVRTGSLSSDQVDVIGGVQPNDVQVLKTSDLPVVSRANPGVAFGLGFNEQSPKLGDVRVREAVARAVDSVEVRDTALNDLFAVGTSALAKTTPGYKDESGRFTHDAKKAAKLLDEAGWKLGSDGVREKDGEPLELKLIWISNFGPNQTSLELIQQQLKKVGVKLTLDGGAVVPDFLAKQQSGDFDITWGNQSRADGDILRTAFSSAGTNYYRIDDAELETLLQQQLATGDADARDKILGQVQDQLATQYYHVPIHELTSILGTQQSVHGVSFGADSRLDLLTAAWKDGE